MLFFRRPSYPETLMAHLALQSYRSEGCECLQLELQREPMNANESDSSTLEKMDLHSTQSECSVDCCKTESIIVLGERPLCLQHFITRCYEWLDQLDPAIRKRIKDAAEITDIKSHVEECSNRTLLVSLRCESLTNLDRSRLLDILLRCSDLLYALRIPSNIAAWLPIDPPELPKPQSRSKAASLGSQLYNKKSYGF